MADFDLRSLQRIETEDKFTFVTRSGTEFSMSSPKSAGWQSALAVTQGQFEPFLKATLGADYERFTHEDLTLADLEAIMSACAEHFGLDTGKSLGSTT